MNVWSQAASCAFGGVQGQLMQEMQRDAVKYAAQQLGKENMELATDLPSFPVRGLVYGSEMGRRVACLTVQRIDKM
jgi:hypothetical protein